MKAFTSLLLVLALLIGLVACYADPSDSSPPSSTRPIQTLPTEPTTESGAGTTEPTLPDHVHQWQDATCTAPKHCVTCGEDQGAPMGHNWQDATAGGSKTCVVCGATESGVIYDIPQDNSVVFPENDCFEQDTIIKVEPITEGNAMEAVDQAMDTLAEQYIAYEFTAVKDGMSVQPNGKLTVIFAIPEGFSNDVSVFYIPEYGLMERLDATIDTVTRTVTVELKHFSTYGIVDQSTQTCEHVYTEEITSATCITNGYTLVRCEKCNHAHKENLVDVLAHSWVDATCSAPKTCAVCHTTEGDLLDHLWDDGVITKAPTDETAGEMLYTCKDCQATMTAVIPELNHEHQFESVVVPPTCTEKGYTTYTCRCGETKTGDETAATGHNWKPATCTEPEICSRCNAQQGVPHGHSSEDGTCSYCGKEIVKYSEGLSFTLSFDRTYYILSGLGTCTDTVIKIPPTYNGLPVCEIDGYALSLSSQGEFFEVIIPDSFTSINFRRCINLVSVTIPDSVTTIGNWAFEGCINLTSVTIPDSVTTIGRSAFESCISLKSITLPNSITSIGSMAFHGCANLTEITIPDSVTTINNSTFRFCESLTSITFPDSVTHIDGNAFDSCYALTTVELPRNLCDLAATAFMNCHALRELNISAENENFCTQNGILYNKDMTKLLHYPANKVETSFTIPQSVQIIDKYAFYGCTQLQAIRVGSQVTTIEESAFSRCENLNSIELSEGLTFIGSYCFASCSSLEVIEIPIGVTSISYGAFSSCDNLRTVHLSNTVTAIEMYAFENCISLQEITIPASVRILETCFRGCTNLQTIYFLGEAPDELFYIFGSGEVDHVCIAYYPANDPSWTANIASFGAFILLPDSYQEGYYSQGLSYSLSEDGTYYVVDGIGTCTDPTLIIPATYNNLPVCAIAESAFADCNFTGLFLPESLHTIGANAFKSISYMKIPSHNVSFNNCLVSVNYFWVEPSNTYYIMDNDALYTHDMKTLICYRGASRQFTIPEGVLQIADYAFAHNNPCKYLTELQLPDSITTLPISAITRCGSLAKIQCSPNSLIYFENGILYDNPVTKILWVSPTISGHITIHDGITAIEDYAFAENRRLTGIVIPSSVVTIGAYAFFDCTQLRSITLSDSVTFIDKTAFEFCRKLTEIICSERSHFCFVDGILYDNPTTQIIWVSPAMPEHVVVKDGVTTIDNSAFYYSNKLKSVVLPDSVTSISADAFYGCRYLESISIPDSVTSIGAYAFAHCYQLKSIVLPAGLTSVEEYTFAHCERLTEVTIPASVKQIGEMAFHFGYDDPSAITIRFLGTIAQWNAVKRDDKWCVAERSTSNGSSETVVIAVPIHCTDGTA